MPIIGAAPFIGAEAREEALSADCRVKVRLRDPGQPGRAKRVLYCGDDAWAMVGIQQQNATFCFLAAYYSIAPEKLQVNGVLDNQFRA